MTRVGAGVSPPRLNSPHNRMFRSHSPRLALLNIVMVQQAVIAPNEWYLERRFAGGYATSGHRVAGGATPV